MGGHAGSRWRHSVPNAHQSRLYARSAFPCVHLVRTALGVPSSVLLLQVDHVNVKFHGNKVYSDLNPESLSRMSPTSRYSRHQPSLQIASVAHTRVIQRGSFELCGRLRGGAVHQDYSQARQMAKLLQPYCSWLAKSSALKTKRQYLSYSKDQGMNGGIFDFHKSHQSRQVDESTSAGTTWHFVNVFVKYEEPADMCEDFGERNDVFVKGILETSRQQHNIYAAQRAHCAWTSVPLIQMGTQCESFHWTEAMPSLFASDDAWARHLQTG
eukprot:6469871-Amphidinium_carterae.1